MPISKIKTGSIATDAITEAKIADTAIENEHLNTTIITGFSELAEVAADGDFLIIFDTSVGTLKKILRSNITLQVPIVTSISPTNVDSKDSATTTTFTVTGTGFDSGVTAKLISNGGTEISFNTVTRDSATQLTCVLNNGLITGDGLTDEPYDIKVTNGSGLAVTLANQVNVDQRPVFVTAAGSLGTVLNGNVSTTTFTIEATDPESAGAVRFDVVGGSLSTGASLNSSTGVISGFSSVGADTTSTFTVQASDVDSNVSFREFSITVNAPVSESFTSSGTFSVPSGITAVDVLVVAGGGGGGGLDGGGGGGAGGLIFRPGFPVTPGGTVAVTVGCGGAAPFPTCGSSGQDSIFGTLTAKGGGGGGRRFQTPGTLTGTPGGSGGGGGGCAPGSGGPGGGGPGNPGGSATQPTQPGDSGTYGFGNSGGLGRHKGGFWVAGGGGGGANAAGGSVVDTASSSAGAGGQGKAYTIADGTTPVFYAGGGGGGGTTEPNPAPGASGGQGGGASGATSGPVSTPAGTATANRGGGGGGAGHGTPNPATVNSAGAKGIVIVSY